MAYEYTTQGFTVNDSGRRIVVDPITRIEGHLRCEVNINDENVITNAVSSGAMFRGIEIIVKDRDPRDAWAFVERICGVCTGTHALTSVYAVEDALGIQVPENANIIRNLMQLLPSGSTIIWSISTSLGAWTGSTWFPPPRPIQRKPPNWPRAFPRGRSPRRAILARCATSSCASSPRGSSSASSRTATGGIRAIVCRQRPISCSWPTDIEALDFQKRHGAKIHTVFGGKNPHPNWLVGGVPLALNLNAKGGVDVINMERLQLVQQIITRCRDFTAQVLVPDSIALARDHPDSAAHRYRALEPVPCLAFGGFPLLANDFSQENLARSRAARSSTGGAPRKFSPSTSPPRNQVREEVGRAWYSYPKGVTSLHPYQGGKPCPIVLGPGTKGTMTDIRQLDETAPYSWIKTPRWRGHMMEVGPLARTLVAYALKGGGHRRPGGRSRARINAPVSALSSTMGRILTRAQEARWEVLVYVIEGVGIKP